MPEDDPGLAAHQEAVAHLRELQEALWSEEDEEEEVLWPEGMTAPFDGCDDCVVREVLTVGIQSLIDAGAITVTEASS